MEKLRNHPLTCSVARLSPSRIAGLALTVIGLAGLFLPKLVTVNILAHTGTEVDGTVSLSSGNVSSHVNLSEWREARTRFMGDEALKQALENKHARPLALASADFDEDGVPDLVGGYAISNGGVITLHRGNIDSIFPNSPEAKQRKVSGQFTDSPFLVSARLFAAPAPPDFLQAGDFDADGHYDLVAATQGGNALFVLHGDGNGGFSPAERIDLPGPVSAMEGGEINKRDGLADVVVAIAGAQGPKGLIFAGPEGALKSKPEAFDLPAQAMSLALGNLDDDYLPDLAVAAGRDLLIIHGKASRVSAKDSGRTEAAASRLEKRTLPFAISSVTAGDFNADRRSDLALISQDGDLHLLSNPAGAVGAGLARWESEVAARGLGSGAARLVRARLAGRRADDLLLADSSGRQLHVLTSEEKSRSRNTFILAPMSVEAGVAAVLPMRLNADARDDLVMIGAGRSAPTVALTPSATLVVTNTTDSEPGSLRQAILDANANPDADTITFNIPGPGPHTITPATPLPPIENGSVTIDGTSEPDFDGSPVIELSGAIVGTSGDGLTIDEVGGTVVRGLVINRFNAGIRVLDASNNLIEGNYLGTDVSGTAALGNSVGVACERSGLITIGGTVAEARNLISGNRVGITGTVAAVQGNFIGTDVTGTDALGNTFRGASFDGSVEATIGGTEPGSRNIISGNGGDGASFVDSGGSLIQGNYIGLDISGTNPLGNSGNGLILTEVPHTVGGTTPAARNVISANSGHGIEMTSFGTADVLGNFIGTDNTGTRALGNGASGIMCNLSNVIGGTTAGARNVISGNGGDGITVESIENIVLGNFIGTDVTGTSALGNMGHGVQVMDIANVVGGLDDGAGNLIAFNGGDGVSVPGADRFGGILILSNSIFSNGGLGIDLLDDGVTPNDPCDADREIEFTSLQNFPVITSAVASASGVTIRGQLNSRPNISYLLQFFSNTAADPSGFGEGETLIGSATVTTNGSCIANFAVTLSATVAAGQFITATATDQATVLDRATSEFSNAVAVVVVTPEQAAQLLIDQVNELVAQGVLNKGNGNALAAKLRTAIKQIERGNFNAAANQLRAFINQVEAFVRSGKLSPAQGQALIDSANAIIGQITS